MRKIAVLAIVFFSVLVVGCGKNSNPAQTTSSTDSTSNAEFFVAQAALEGSAVPMFNLIKSDTAFPGVAITSFGGSAIRASDSVKYYYQTALVARMSDNNGGGVSCWGGMVKNTPVVALIDFSWYEGGVASYGGAAEVYLGNKKILTTLSDALAYIYYVPGDLGRGIKEKIVMIESGSPAVSASDHFEVHYYDFSTDTTYYVGQAVFSSTNLSKPMAH
ncbi:MAG: hypothetical protein PHO56_00535 [Patescibacteria group bacterium]|nr:hypothetical protein [Patescibacteria group bacterium]